MSTQSISEAIRFTIHQYAETIFNIPIDTEFMTVDFAKVSQEGIEATFSHHSIVNVGRKWLTQRVEDVKKIKPYLKVFKVKSKRPNQNVRFYILTNNKTLNSNEQS